MFLDKLILYSFLTCTLWQVTLGILTSNDVPRLRKFMSLDLNENLNNLEYGKYLNDVFEALKEADGFTEKVIEEYKQEGMEGVKIVDEYHSKVPAHIRSKLDELKRIEVERLTKYSAMLRSTDVKDEKLVEEMKKKLKHVDMKKTLRFGSEDLRKLINQTMTHLKVLEHIRKASFKEYEMHKHLEVEELLKRLTPEERKKLENHTDVLRKYHKRRPPMYIPLSKPHLLEVWEARDRMNREYYNQRTFFKIHDLNGDNLWDEDEVKTLLVTEVNRAYNTSDPNFDVREKEEALERMWEYTFKNVDADKDRFISYGEFVLNTISKDVTDVEFWESIGNKPEFTQEEYENYAKEHREEVNRMIDLGKIHLPETNVVASLKGAEDNPSLNLEKKAEGTANLKPEKESEDIASIKLGKEFEKIARLKLEKEAKDVASSKSKTNAEEIASVKLGKETEAIVGLKVEKEAEDISSSKLEKELEDIASSKLGKETEKIARLKLEEEEKVNTKDQEQTHTNMI